MLRRLAKDLAGLRAELATHNLLLARIADTFCPVLSDSSAADRVDRADTGVTFLDPIELGLSLDFVTKIERATGRAPTEDELLTYLADEKTIDLHARLVARDAEIAQMTSERAGER